MLSRYHVTVDINRNFITRHDMWAKEENRTGDFGTSRQILTHPKPEFTTLASLLAIQDDPFRIRSAKVSHTRTPNRKKCVMAVSRGNHLRIT